ncbi:calcium motive P-type ATPase, putative [Trichomonas vaginalis G3]|uniref:Calcium-transporting ATPase n=1 Tax=Trichomonas vaginalis (strain ATCC PRA-98 / G3) TaxID=412133 RepID=A2E3V9_TRIV3|nr:calcium-transporting ATPase protein [Trichomonas vaginalis G3]EAY12614.1 calcium motive P-type ATPase, putative [Trichomonas vaginalis G3]KAI5546977.1 calcium-transporting ATPase protein [Trichomonas vaginalis G3]|eukprot:XP_001324837.1 calcium motive P-type ATPase [Trichomonas vaginalis G3]
MLSYDEVLDMFDRRNLEAYNKMGKVKGFAEALEVDLETGLTDDEAKTGFEKRIEKYGRNILPDPPTESWCHMYIMCFTDLMLIILLAAAVVSLILECVFSYKDEGASVLIEPLSIFAAVLIVSLVQTQVDYSQQQSFLEINKLKNSYEVNVIRGGHEVQILSTEVMMGDILSLKSGNAIAADCLYIRGQDLKVNNSAQTGESDAIPVHDDAPFVYGGTAVETGFGHCLVVAIGPHTRSGDMMMKIQDLEGEKKDELSPLEAKLEKVALILTYIGAIGAVITFIVLLVYFILDHKKLETDDDKKKHWPDLIHKFMVAVTIFICAVPEGLPLAVTIALGFSMKRMMNDQNFVRHLNACETMGGATAICSDKTGTLTQNKMTVVRFYQIGSQFQSGTNPTIDNKDILELFTKAVAINSTAFKTTTTEKKKIGKKVEEITKTGFVGSSSECALLQLLEPWGKDYEQIRKDANILHVHEFSSARKKMSTIVKEGDSVRAYMKGGPDFCLGLCTHYMSAQGERLEITEQVKQSILETVTIFANDSLRTMLIAYRDLGTEFKEEYKDATTVEHDLTIIGIVGIQDPLREEVKDAVANCRTAGVVVRMVTGDFIATAKAIARECGILDESKGEIAMEGQEFAKLDKLEMLEKVPHLRVMARSSPMDKLRLVSFLMEAGEVVAVTGDGSNDSPALKQADVGLSMGRCGTELAKMASDIVILDDNFNSIVSALKWGRCVYDNVRGFLQFQLTVNFAAMIVAFIGAIALHQSPLTTLQLLWVNLIMDSFGALALATRGPSNSLLKRKPYGRGDQLLSNILIRNIVGHTIYQTAVLLLILFGYNAVFGLNVPDKKFLGHDLSLKEQDTYDKQLSGLIFNTFVFMQVFNLPNARITGQDTPFFEGLFSNIFFVAIFFGIIVVQIIIVEFAGKVFDHELLKTPKEWLRWIIALAFGLGSLVIGLILRLIKLPDRTEDKLNALRAERAQLIRDTYTGMPKDEQFKRHINAKGRVVKEGEEDNSDSSAPEDSGSGVSISAPAEDRARAEL